MLESGKLLLDKTPVTSGRLCSAKSTINTSFSFDPFAMK